MSVSSAPTSGYLRPKRRSAAVAVAPARSINWVVVYVVLYILSQVALLFLGSTPLRLPLRISAFALSLVFFVLLPRRGPRHPAAGYVPLILLSFLPGFLVGDQPSIIAELAQVTLYFSTLTPLFWVSDQPVTFAVLRKVILVLWLFNFCSAGVGVLQTYFPGSFQAQLSSVVEGAGEDYVGSLKIELANGQRMLRPMGLTDSPGGAANGGQAAILLGVGILFSERSRVLQCVAFAGMLLGIYIIFLSQVRVALITSAVSVLVVCVVFVRAGQLPKVIRLLTISLTVAILGASWAFLVGGDKTVARFSTLIDSRPGDVYSQNRGFFLEDAFTNSLFKFPLGAGPGRWGMISYYFGGGNGLWSEIIWSAWIYDGGIMLLVAYCTIIGISIYTAWKVGVKSADERFAVWGAVIAAYNIAAVAATFDCNLFATQGGVEYWFLNACLFTAWRRQQLSIASPSSSEILRPALNVLKRPRQTA